MFIATAGGATIRLGAVEVQLIEKELATDFIKEKQSKVPEARQELETAQSDYESFAERTANELKPMKERLEQLLAENRRLRDAAEADHRRLLDAYWRAMDQGKMPLSQKLSSDTGLQCGILWTKAAALLYRPGEALSYPHLFRGRVYPVAEIPSVKRWREFVDGSTRDWPNLLGEIQVRRDAADRTKADKKSRIATAESHLANLTTRELLIADFSAVATTKANTDADGNFSLTYPRSKKLTIFAKARRTALGAGLERTQEEYFWLVDAPVDPKGARVLLNNNNLVEVDPDGYFRQLASAE